MSEQIIIPAVEEAAAAERDAFAAIKRAFLSQWTMEEMPACPIGMDLLFDFVMKQPAAFEMARQRRFVDPPRTVVATPGWRAYSEHVAHCHDCNESGANPVSYEGRPKQTT